MKIFITLAVLLVIAFIYVLRGKIEEYNVLKSGNFVTVTVKHLPNCSSGHGNKFIRINYEGKTYSLRTHCKYINGLYPGQQIRMLHKPGTSIFLFEQADVKTEIIANILLIAFMLICLVFLLKPHLKR